MKILFRKYHLIFAFILLPSIVIAQTDSTKYESDNAKLENVSKPDNDWDFHPFSVNLSPGVWIPMGSLQEYYNPSFQLGFSLGIEGEKLRIEFMILPKFINVKREIEVSNNQTKEQTETPMGGGMGGWFYYKLYHNRILYCESIIGFSWETLDTEIDHVNPRNENDTKLSVSTWGITVGLNTWINKFGNQNIGIRFFYNYAAYNNDEILISNLGGHSMSVAIVYRFPKRNIRH